MCRRQEKTSGVLIFRYKRVVVGIMAQVHFCSNLSLFVRGRRLLIWLCVLRSVMVRRGWSQVEVPTIAEAKEALRKAKHDKIDCPTLSFLFLFFFHSFFFLIGFQPTALFFLTGLLARIWMCCKRIVLTINGM